MRRVRRVFLAGLGVTALIACGSYAWQFRGLAGASGIAPLAQSMASLREGGASPWEVPTLLWLSSSDVFLQALLALCCVSALSLIAGLAPRLSALVLWASWGSLVQVGQPFLSFQWDLLLVETAFFAAWYAPGVWRLGRSDEPEPLAATQLLMAVLACKVTLESGLVKWLGGDPSWRDLTALTFHWWTQPLPTWSSVLFARVPLVGQQALCAAMFVLELVFPVLLFGPRRVRNVGALGLVLLQLGLAVAGNYSFYNLLTAVLAVPCLTPASAPPLTWSTGRGWWWLVTGLYVALSVAAFMRWSNPALEIAGRFRTVNAYGAFGHMTRTRPEIELEGSEDGVTWTPYVLPWKPGPLNRRPDFVAPWQPRLDWQFWFAALGSCRTNPWLLSTQAHLLRGTPQVLALFESGPRAPRFIRSRVFEYRFAPPGTEDWWVRTETGPYCPPLTLNDGALELMR